MKILSLAVAVLVFGACGGEAADSVTVADATIVLIRVGHDGDAANVPSPDWVNPRDIVLDDRDNLYIRDEAPARIVMLDPDGRLLRAIGHEGEGPREYQNPKLIARGGRLLVHDAPLGRLTMFDTMGTVLWTARGPCCRLFDPQIDQEQQIYAAEAPMRIGPSVGFYRIVRHSPDGEPLDTLEVPSPGTGPEGTWEYIGPEMATAVSIPFAPRMHVQVTPTGTILFGHSSDYRLIEMRRLSDTVRIIRRVWTPVTIPDSTRQLSVEALAIGYRRYGAEQAARTLMKLEDVPSSYPAFLGLKVDHCRRWWVLRAGQDGAIGSIFDVFSADGEMLATVGVPEVPALWSVGVGRLAMIVESPSGIAELVLYRLASGVQGC